MEPSQKTDGNIVSLISTDLDESNTQTKNENNTLWLVIGASSITALIAMMMKKRSKEVKYENNEDQYSRFIDNEM